MADRVRAIAVVFAIGIAAGCESAWTEPSADGLTRQDWIAESIVREPVIEPGRVTLAFTDGRVSGRGGCNLYSGPVEIGNGTLKVGTLISTKMACGKPGVMQQESAYLNALRAAERFSFSADGRLTIESQAGPLIYRGVPKQQRPESP